MSSIAMKMINRMTIVALSLLGFFLCAANVTAMDNFKSLEQPNILFILVDDLRTELPVYGKDHIVAPNIDRLAKESVVFQNAYVNVPVCGASRASMMTGIRPTESRFVGYQSRMDEDAPNAIPLFSLLKDNGYFTQSLGKVMHFSDDSKQGWSVPTWHPRLALARGQGTGHRNYQLEENIRSFKKNRKGPAYESADVPDNAYYDGQITDHAIEALEKFKSAGQPFFLTVGFLKPHLPFNAPKKYWDLYDPAKLALSDNPFLAEGMPKQARHSWGEMRKYIGVPKSPDLMPDELALKLMHGYYAGVSYIDAQVGMVMDALRANGLEENTIVVFAGDHGFFLGEHGFWAKHSPFDLATHTPLIVKLPDNKVSGNSDGLVEFVDIYSTLVDLLDIEPPPQLQGSSFAPLLHDLQAPGKEAVYPRWQKGEVIKTEKYAMTEWYGKSGRVQARMLYDHSNDRTENNNLANDPAYKKTVDALHQKLKTMMENR